MSLWALCRLLVVAAFGLALSGCDTPNYAYNGSAEVHVLTQPTGGVGLDSTMCTFSTVMHRTDPDSIGDNIVLEGQWGYGDGSFWGSTVWYLNTKDPGITRTVTLHGYNGAKLKGQLHFEWTWTDDGGEHRASTDTVACTAP